MRPSDEKSTSFCNMLLRTRSAFRPHADAVVAGGSQPVPMRNFFSALRMVVRNVLSALGESSPVCTKRMPNSFGPWITEAAEDAVAMLDGVAGVIGIGLPGVGGTTQRRGLTRGSDGGGGNVGVLVLDTMSDAVDCRLDVEPLVPLRTNCFSPATGEVKRVGDASPGVSGGEVGVGHGGITLGS